MNAQRNEPTAEPRIVNAELVDFLRREVRS